MNDDFILISIDVELSGPRIKKNGIVEIGACAYSLKTKENVDTFSILINLPMEHEFDEKTLKEFWDNKENIGYERLQKVKKFIMERGGYDPKFTMNKFVNWLKNIFKQFANSNINNIQIIVDTVSIECYWINSYIEEYTKELPLHLLFGSFKDVIDTHSFTLGLCRMSYEDLSKENLSSEDKFFRQKFGLKEVPSIKNDHCALNDSIYIMQEHLLQIKCFTNK